MANKRWWRSLYVTAALAAGSLMSGCAANQNLGLTPQQADGIEFAKSAEIGATRGPEGRESLARPVAWSGIFDWPGAGSSCGAG